MKQIALDAEPEDEIISPFEGAVTQEAIGGPSRSGPTSQQVDVRVDEVTHVGLLQRAVSQVKKAARGLFRSKN